jgi:3-oxoacyl-[acyl-carrier-protein] synthase II
MREVWITGIGLITALGTDRETSWEKLVRGDCGIRPLTLFDTAGYRTHLAAQVEESALEAPPFAAGAARHASRTSRLALRAVAEALDDAKVAPASVSGKPWGLVLGGGSSGMFEAEGFLQRRLTGGPRTTGLTELLEVPQDAATDRLAEALALTGPRVTVTTACSSTTLAVGLAAGLGREGEVEVALAGGADGLCRLTYAGFNSLRAVDPDPCKPFDRRRKGLSLGEGAAILVLEPAEGARRRSVRPYARVAGYGVTSDAFHMTQPEPTGRAWERTLRAALCDAGMAPEEIAYVNAHGTATEKNDSAECAAYHRLLGERMARVPVSSVKGALGHCLCGAGGIEAAITAMVVSRGVVPPTVGFAEPDEACRIDPVPVCGRHVPVPVALSSSFAFGGNSAVLVLAAAV